MKMYIPNGHRYNKDMTIMYINPPEEETPTEEKLNNTALVNRQPDAHSDLGVYLLPIVIVVLTGQMFGWVECIMVICVVVLLLWALATWTRWQQPKEEDETGLHAQQR